MNTPKMVAALNTISLAFGELAEGLVEGTNGQIPVSTPATPPGPSGALTEPEFPPFAPADYEQLPIEATPQNEPVLGRCPDHDTSWTVRQAGVSKAGKSYQSFWKCDGKTPDGGFCSKKPVKAWADAHPLS